MSDKIRYAHTNLVAKDWQRLVQFYIEVFGCEPVPPERDLKGDWLENAVLVPDAHIRGIHLRLPGYGEDGPTLEIFSYNKLLPRRQRLANFPGYGHIAFIVKDVRAMRDRVFIAGGSEYGQMVTARIPGIGKLTFVYVLDPEGNIIELQKRENEEGN
jgi:catechol 2,3-dioxygenase-like lactoylglutathione lyase family enzyme